MDNVIDIDLNHLDKEWQDQAARMQTACRRVAKGKKKLAEAKAFLELTFARLDLKVRTDPKKFKIKRVSEAAIKQVIVTLKSYQEANRLFIQAKFEVDNLEALVSALEHRKKALENEVTLWSQGYFATPRVQKGTEDDVRRKLDRERTKRLVSMGRLE